MNVQVCLVFLIQASLLLEQSGGSAEGRSRAERAARKLEWEIDTRRSVELRMHTELRLGDSSAVPLAARTFDSWDQHFIEDGARMYTEFQYLSGGTPVSRDSHYSDGSRCTHITYSGTKLDEATQVVVKREYYNEPAGDRVERPDSEAIR